MLPTKHPASVLSRTVCQRRYSWRLQFYLPDFHCGRGIGENSERHGRISNYSSAPLSDGDPIIQRDEERVRIPVPAPSQLSAAVCENKLMIDRSHSFPRISSLRGGNSDSDARNPDGYSRMGRDVRAYVPALALVH